MVSRFENSSSESPCDIVLCTCENGIAVLSLHPAHSQLIVICIVQHYTLHGTNESTGAYVGLMKLLLSRSHT
jgi:hypothetical protein